MTSHVIPLSHKKTIRRDISLGELTVFKEGVRSLTDQRLLEPPSRPNLTIFIVEMTTNPRGKLKRRQRYPMSVSINPLKKTIADHWSNLFSKSTDRHRLALHNRYKESSSLSPSQIPSVGNCPVPRDSFLFARFSGQPTTFLGPVRK